MGQNHEPPQARVMHIIAGYWLSRALYLASRLKLADCIGEVPESITGIAAATGTSPATLRRLMRALAADPELLLMDEPFAAVDPITRDTLQAELARIHRVTTKTIMFVTHDVEEALRLATQIAIMNEGRIEQVGSPQDVYLRPSNPFVAGFLGAVNWIGGVGIRPPSDSGGNGAGMAGGPV